VVVGLGNPGSEFVRTRHNVGAEVVELLAERHGGKLKKRKERALADDVRIGDARVLLAIPLTFMNESGQAVAPLLKHSGLGPDRIVVVHDELDLPVATLKVKFGGGLAGHNGLRSIKSHLHTDEFARVRIGVGKPPGGKDHGVDHVLKKFGKAERAEIDITIQRAADAVEAIVREGIDAAMNTYNVQL
jgi:PTH1 family peptidyl-tRNA hydrolase